MRMNKNGHTIKKSPGCSPVQKQEEVWPGRPLADHALLTKTLVSSVRQREEAVSP
ncbi:hypothetical protein [Streptomyces lydicus]|uniref:hypothetical protein n=1 Tax=Streptomyces lydicus TaxID=47763 RepID=UPI00369883BD